MRLMKEVLILVAVGGSAGNAATIRPGGDPPAANVIWADPFDFYNKWAWDNRDNPLYARGTRWQGGPVPAGNPSGGYPSKAPTSGCGTSIQVDPADHEMARAQWLGNDCAQIISPGGIGVGRSKFEANIDEKCGKPGQIAVNTGQYALIDSTWGQGGSFTSMGQYTHYFGDRIRAIADYRGVGPANGVMGTDEHPLVAVFYLNDTSVSGSNLYADQFDNSYVELSMIGDLANRHDANAMAPTDYIWMGDPFATWPSSMDACPTGPYPVICQQAREQNGSGTDDPYYLQYVNDHCPALNTTKTWRSVAVGFLAISDTNPCGVTYPKNMADAHGERHKPQALRLAVFDGNQWRQLAAGRFHGLNKTAWPPAFPWDPGMSVGEPNASDDVTLTGGTVRVVLKFTTQWMMVYATTSIGGAGEAHRGAAISRALPAYAGAFDTIRWGVGPGCELDPQTGACKDGGTPRQCLTYSRSSTDVPVGYDRTILDSAAIYNGEVLYMDILRGRCCKPDGTCDFVDQVACTNAGGTFMGVNTTCDGAACAGACCQARGTCSETAINACPGDFAGYGTACSTEAICGCPTPFADYDRNGYVDMDDFAGLQTCLTQGDSAISPVCSCFDYVKDGLINAADIDQFVECATGKDVSWTPSPACPD